MLQRKKKVCLKLFSFSRFVPICLLSRTCCLSSSWCLTHCQLFGKKGAASSEIALSNLFQLIFQRKKRDDRSLSAFILLEQALTAQPSHKLSPFLSYKCSSLPLTVSVMVSESAKAPSSSLWLLFLFNARSQNAANSGGPDQKSKIKKDTGVGARAKQAN